MQNYHPNQSTASYHRLIALVVLIAIFIVVAMERIWEMRVAAERTHVAWMAGALQSAIGIETVVRSVRGGLPEIAKLDHSNPLDLLMQSTSEVDTAVKAVKGEQGDSLELPDNKQSPFTRGFTYLGELDAPNPADIEPRSWYFDTSSRELIYRVVMEDAFSTNLEGPARIRFALRARYSDQNGAQQDASSLVGIRLIELDDYRWIEAK